MFSRGLVQLKLAAVLKRASSGIRLIMPGFISTLALTVAMPAAIGCGLFGGGFAALITALK
jgi:hypothetical protein